MSDTKKASPKKQRNLFSFFSKPSPSSSLTSNSSSTTSPKKTKTNTHKPTASKKSTSTTNPNKKSNTTPTITTSPKRLQRNGGGKEKLLSQVRVGTRLSVLWPDDNEFYAATVTAKKRHLSQESKNVVTLVYDDGDVETLDLSKEQFKILPAVVAKVPETKAQTKKLRIMEDSEEECEFDEEAPADDSDSDGDDDDASAFIAPSDDEESEEEEDTTMVTDEDDVAMAASCSQKSNASSSSSSTTAATIKRPLTLTTPYENQRKRPATTSRKMTNAGATTGSIASFITPPPSKRSSTSDTRNAFSSFAATTNAMELDDDDCRKNIFPKGSSNTITPIIAPKPKSKPTDTNTNTNTNTNIPKPPQPENGIVNPAGSHYHNHFTFLQPHKRLDGQKRPLTHPQYDPRTLHVNYNDINKITKLTPASEQWWDIKSRYADTVLLFKVGKFYEMFHMDADIGVQVLNFSYMKGCPAHAGFPEIGYGQFCERLVKAGYKVARVEQTETPDMMKGRKKSGGRCGKSVKVVNREVCSVVSAGTRTFCYMDDIRGLEGVEGVLTSLGPLLAIKEVLVASDDGGEDGGGDDEEEVQPVCEYGIAIIDAARGIVTLGQFADDVLRSRMNTLLTNFRPIEILVESSSSGSGASPHLISMLKSAIQTVLPSCRLETVQSTEYFPKSSALDPEIRSKIERPNPRIQPWDVKETIAELHRKRYYPRSSRKKAPSVAVLDNGGGLSSGTSRWPDVLKVCVKGRADLALAAFGASLFYLQRSLIDEEILSMGLVKAYYPINNSSGNSSSSDTANAPTSNDTTADAELRKIATEEYKVEDGIIESSPSQNNNGIDQTMEDRCSNGKPTTTESSLSQNQCDDTNVQQDIANAEAQINHMSLDGTTLANLEILSNLHSNSISGSLWSKINFTKSPHGSRLLRAWLLRPLFRKADIDRRADAVEELTSGATATAMSEVRALLGKCGDMERLLSRVHSMGGNGVEEGGSGEGSSYHHPSERAVLYETATHTKRKVGDFSKLLYGLRTISQIPEVFSVDIHSQLLARIVRTKENGGFFPTNLNVELDWFFENFDCNLAAKGMFELSEGIDNDYDDACAQILSIKEQLEEYRVDMCSNVLIPSHTATRAWKYANIKDESKDKYLIELPVGVSVPGDFIVRGKRGNREKQVNKYRTPVVERLVKQLECAIDVMKAGKARGMQLIFAKFDSMRSLWASVTQATAMLDALGALAEASMRAGYCRPTIVDCPLDGSPSIHVEQGRHPCVDFTHSGNDFVPNDLSLGGNVGDDHDGSRMLLLSGPNMGGKSTLLRQTCLIAVLAQIGCYVPAEACTLTPFDRIFTRLGASDRILLGQSTFFVELAETAAALRGATRRSLVIMDELGRGTSTFDGTAIAGAAVEHLIDRNRCLTLFATHYHSLLEDWKDKRYVRLGHMECLVGGGDEDMESNEVDDKIAENVTADRNITFLYTLGEGSCPKSFGINVAHLAGLPSEVLSKAKDVSSNFEAAINGTVEASTGRQTSFSVVLPLRKRLEDAVAAKDWDEVERLWDELQ